MATRSTATLHLASWLPIMWKVLLASLACSSCDLPRMQRDFRLGALEQSAGLVPRTKRSHQRTPRTMFPKTHKHIGAFIPMARCCQLMVLLTLAQPWIIGLAHTALQSFWPMLRTALSRIKSNPCRSTWSPRSLFRKVFAHQAGRTQGRSSSASRTKKCKCTAAAAGHMQFFFFAGRRG